MAVDYHRLFHVCSTPYGDRHTFAYQANPTLIAPFLRVYRLGPMALETTTWNHVSMCRTRRSQT